ncbi:MAG: alpha/beta fold hydrolase, partial [Caldimonas sp.]
MLSRAGRVGPPSKLLWAREVVALAELGAFFAAVPWWRLTSRGDGHPVLVLPGLAQSDLSTRPMRSFLADRGYIACPWGLGRNSGSSRLLDEHLLARLHALHEQNVRKVSIVGWSMGGLFARALARRAPTAVRQVITLGSPFTSDPKASNAWRLYEAMSGDCAGDPSIAERFQAQLSVPTTSIYSRRDGIVAWQCCLNEAGPQVENIEVSSSHCGLGHHPAVLYAVADRLAQPEDQWQPFNPKGHARGLFPTRKANAEAHHGASSHAGSMPK